jgi:hypothetical protein
MISKEIKEITDLVNEELGSLNVVQLNWKPATDQWNIGQCLDHLIVSNSKYLPVFKVVISGTHKPTFWERKNPFSKYTGANMIKTLGSQVTKKFIAPKLFMPTGKTIGQEIIAQFNKHQEELTTILNELEKEKYEKIIITSPVAGLITIPLHDAIKIIVNHEMRHILQAIRIKNMPDFPKS